MISNVTGTNNAGFGDGALYSSTNDNNTGMDAPDKPVDPVAPV